MLKFFVALIFLPAISFGQINSDYSLLIPSNLKLKPVLDSINYIEAKPRLAILNYLNSNKLRPENYFIDSSVRKAGDTLCIQVWDAVGLQTMNSYNKKRDSLDNIYNTPKGKRLKLPKPIGNPGNCFTAYFDVKRNFIIAVDLWQ